MGTEAAISWLACGEGLAVHEEEEEETEEEEKAHIAQYSYYTLLWSDDYVCSGEKESAVLCAEEEERTEIRKKD